MAIRPVSIADSERLKRAFAQIAQQDQAVMVAPDFAFGRAIVRGTSEMRLDLLCHQLRNEYDIDIEADAPEVIYLETIRRKAEAEGKYIRQVGGYGNYGHCKLRIEPNESGKGYEFISAVKADAVPREYVLSVEEGVRCATQLGILAGYPIVDIKITLFDGSYHQVDSNEMAFKIAGSIAFKEAARKSWPVVLEPVMAIEATVPEDFMGAVIGDINSRRGRIQGIERRGGSQTIRGFVPLAETLKSNVLGPFKYPMSFSTYEPRPFPGEFGDSQTSGVPALRPNQPNSGDGVAEGHFDSDLE
jgi:elongation factor G